MFARWLLILTLLWPAAAPAVSAFAAEAGGCCHAVAAAESDAAGCCPLGGPTVRATAAKTGPPASRCACRHDVSAPVRSEAVATPAADGVLPAARAGTAVPVAPRLTVRADIASLDAGSNLRARLCRWRL